jgi:hypothetical protein
VRERPSATEARGESVCSGGGRCIGGRLRVRHVR